MCRRVLAPTISVLVSVVAACGDEGGDARSSGGGQGTTKGSGGGGAALGRNAKVGSLARAPLESEPPANAGWVAWRVTLQPGTQVEHEHAFSTVYAQDGVHTLTVDARRDRIEPEGGAIVQSSRRHVHAATDEPSVFWDVLLAAPGTELPGAPRAERVFQTEPLEGIPRQAEVAFLDVVLPPRGGQTTVHTHPGPETIYVTNGPFEYQNGIEGSTTVEDGEHKSIPPSTPVQKRNPGDGKPRFLSWFIVDPSQDFAPSSEFDSSG